MTQKSSAELTSLDLNNVIIGFRKIVASAKVRCTRKIIQQLRALEHKKGTSEHVEKNKRKIIRLSDEVKAIKTIKPDEVTKFALMNTKSFVDLMSVIPSSEKAALYKLVFCDLVVKKVDDFRDKYPLWPVEVPFMLQRLGAQYKRKNKKSQTASKTDSIDAVKVSEKSSTSVDSLAEVQHSGTSPSNSASSETVLSESGLNKPDVAKRRLKLKTRAAKNATGISTKGKSIVKKDAKSAVKNPDPVNDRTATVREGRTGQMEVRRLKLDEIFGDDILENSSKIREMSPKLFESKIDRLTDDPFFEEFDAELEPFPGGKAKIREDDCVDVDLLLGHDDDSIKKKKNSNPDKTNNLKSKFSSSLKSGADKFVEKCAAVPKPKVQTFKRPRNDYKNANFAPIGKPELEQKTQGENRKIRRLKMRQDVEKKAELATLHPSWQAKKRLNNPTLVPSAGKKIVFS